MKSQRSQGRAGAHLQLQQAGASLLGITGPDFERHDAAGERFLQQRPGRFVDIDQLIESSHPHIVAVSAERPARGVPT